MRVVSIFFFFLGEVLHRPHLKEVGEYDIDESQNDLEHGDTPPDEVHRELQKYKRYECHFCDPPTCTNMSVCKNAILCWKSRVRDSTGMVVVICDFFCCIECFL